ncbi:hypothetical protein B0H11DRAFT_2247326, partial [Mycena galericulata]
DAPARPLLAPKCRLDAPPAEAAPARHAPPKKRSLPVDDDSDDEYSEASGAESVANDAAPIQTRSKVAARSKPAARTKPAAAPKPAVGKSKPAIQFDGVEITPPAKKSRPNAAAKPPATQTSAAQGTSRKTTAQRSHNPPPAPSHNAPPAASAPAAGVTLPPALAAMSPAQFQAILNAVAAAAPFGGLPPGA